MTPAELLNIFRLEVDDIAVPQLWSDLEFYAYLSEAQDLHVSAVGGIADRSSSLTSLSYKENDQFLRFDSRILMIKGAWDETNRRISVKNLANFDEYQLSDDYGTQIFEGLDDGLTGDIRYLITDVEDNKIQLYPLPDHNGTIQLFVYRRPLNDVSEKSKFEVPSQYHLNLLNWVKYKCYSKQDVEAFDGKRAAEFRVEFTTGVTRAKKDKALREDRKRTVAYGGIPMT